MTLDLRLVIPKTDLLFQESPLCELEVVNNGSRPLRILNPGIAETMPVFRVVDRMSGLETTHGKRKSGWDPEPERLLKPGERDGMSFHLYDEIPLEAPGDFEISAIYRYEDEGRTVQTESAPVRVKARPSMPSNLTLDGVQGCVPFGAWLNVASDPPEIVTGEFGLAPEAEIRDVQVVGPATLRSRPALSSFPNGTFEEGRWIAWLEGGTFRCAYQDRRPDLESGPSLVLEAAQAQIISPMHSDPPKDSDRSPTGSALLWTQAGDGLGGRLLAVRFSTTGIQQGPAADLPGPCPSWMGSFVRSDGSRRAILAVADGNRVRLLRVDWTDQSIARPTELHCWEGEFVAGSSTLDLEDVLRGALVVRDPNGRLSLAPWEEDAIGSFRVGEAERWRWSSSRPIRRALLRVSSQGVACAAIRGEEGKWSLLSAGESRPFPAGFERTRMPVEIGFLSDLDPVLILGVEGRGFKLLRPDGSPLPTLHG